MLVVKAQIALGAETINCPLHGVGIGKLAVVVVKTNILCANLRERRKLLSAVLFQAHQSALDFDDRQFAEVMANAPWRLRAGIGVWHLIRRPFDLSSGGARRDQPIVARAVLPGG